MIFGIISDIHTGSDKDANVLKTSIKNIVSQGATGLIMAGDIGDNHGQRETAFSVFDEYFPTEYHQNMLLMVGNHDVRSGAQPHEPLDPDLTNLYDAYLAKSKLSRKSDSMCVDTWIGGYHFLCLNTDVPLKDQMELNQTSLDWLKEKLAENADVNKPIFVITHQAFNGSHWGSHYYGGFGPQDEQLKELFLQYPQIVMLNGHLHNGFGVIEAIQRPFGTLIDIPSLTLGENGNKDKGTGYLLKFYDDKLIFEAWNFYENVHLQEHDIIILLPTLSVLAQKLPSNKEENITSLVSKADQLMNKKRDGYGPRIYDNNTWTEINILRDKIINLKKDINYYNLPFSSNIDITEEMINDALRVHDNVQISMSDGVWSRNIHIPRAQNGKTIKVKCNSTYSINVMINKEKHVLKTDYELILSPDIPWGMEQKKFKN